MFMTGVLCTVCGAQVYFLMYYRSSLSVITLRQFFEGVMPLCELRIKVMCSFPHFSHTCFDILSWDLAHDFCFNVLQIKFEWLHFASIFKRPSSDGTYYGMVMSVRVSFGPTLRPSIRPSGSPSVRAPVFRTFLLHTLTYWAEILHLTLFWCTTDQVRLSSLCLNFWKSYASLWT